MKQSASPLSGGDIRLCERNTEEMQERLSTRRDFQPCTTARVFDGSISFYPRRFASIEQVQKRHYSSGSSRTMSTEESDEPAEGIRISDGCVKRLQELVDEDTRNGRPNHSCLRVAVEGGGCSGFQYNFSLISFDEKKKDDVVFERDGVIVVVDKLSLEFLKGATIDYSEELIRASFMVRNL